MMNMGNFMQMLRGSGNPQQMLMNVMKQQMGNNPVMNNAYQMMNSGNAKGIETLCRNLCKERGINPDEAISQIKSQFGMK